MCKEKIDSRVWSTVLLFGLILLIALGTSCNKGLSTERSESVDGNGLPIVTVIPIASSAGSTVGDTLDISVADGSGGFEVTVRAGEDTPPLDEVFFQVEYDPKNIQAESITVDKSSGDGSTINLAIESAPGTIEVGIVSTNQAEDVAIRPGDALLSFKLVEGAATKDVSSANESHLSRPRNLEFKEGEVGWTLSWDYTNPGDNNQDGEVGLADLTPIALNYGGMVDNSWADPLRHIDGDHNGEINLADITPIAINFTVEVWAYQIEMSEDGIRDFITVGQYLLKDYNQDTAETLRFTYEFGAQYVEGAWYRVVALNRNLLFGPPSEAISEAGRRVDPIVVDAGDDVTIVVHVHDLEFPIQHMNAVRVVFPDGFDYVGRSANAGSIGGDKDDPDGIWGPFAGGFLWPTDKLLYPKSIGGGMQAIDFNVSTIDRSQNGSPDLYGDLFNFKLQGDGTNDLTLEFSIVSDDGLLRTYYTDSNTESREFGNKLGFEVF